jgi:hypothetical protein
VRRSWETVIGRASGVRSSAMSGMSRRTARPAGEELIRIVIPPEDRERLVRTYEDFVTWVRTVAEVWSGLGLARLPRAQRDQLTSLFGQPAAESVATAIQEKVPLWTDEATVPVVMNAGHNALRTRTQLVGDPFVVAVEFNQAERAWVAATREHKQEWNRLRAALATRYGVPFP